MKTNENRKIVSEEDFERLVLLCDTDIELKVILYLMFYCGLKYGEIRPLTNNDINLNNRTINIDKQYSIRSKTITSMKIYGASGKRVLEFPESLVENINKLLFLKKATKSRNLFSISNEYLYSVLGRFSRKLEVPLIRPCHLVNSYLYRKADEQGNTQIENNLLSKKTLDKCGRWRNKNNNFRCSQGEAEIIDSFVSLSGMTRQEYLVTRALQNEVVIMPGIKTTNTLEKEVDKMISLLKVTLKEQKKVDIYTISLIKEIIEIYSNIERT